ncbi:unnamed protein product [Peronospora farinosa]|uniref:Uncharacterized protein n=1 Tax=Peronospora farinosa TaxID=134698 RepID=A0ABN8C151_9STRA|nr:unnamed protein product [Peronospora farinosa]
MLSSKCDIVTTFIGVTNTVTPKKRPSSDSSLRKTLVTRWGVLTDTSFLLFDDTTAELLGSMYVLYVSSYAQQQLWEYKIILRRRASLIP